MKKNQVSVDGVIYENLADHEIKIKNGEEIITISANKGKKPELKSRYEETLAPIKTYRQFPVRIDNLPAEKEGTIYIVPLFIVTGARELGMRRKDLVSPGRKVFGDGGKVLYADGLREGYYT